MRQSELARAVSVLKAAASRGFEWNDATGVIAKVQEEIDEVTEAIASGNAKHIKEEIGDVLFAAANLARYMKVDADECLAEASAKFEKRFAIMEDILAQRNRKIEDCGLEELVEAWKEMKAKG